MSPNPKPRTFEDKPAVLTTVPLWLGVYGPTGSGKTWSALRLATGMQRVTGGEIFVIDTEARRALHYANYFTFRHVEFPAPFSPLDYLGAVEHCVSKGARVVVIDSMSHEHEGPGGVLEWQAAEQKRLAKLWNTSEDKAKMSAWQEPKAARRRMINTLLQLPINLIFCFRAKEKLKIIPGRTPEPLGYMPLTGDELAYEMTAMPLLLPGADGVPTWSSKETGEDTIIKRPEQFRALIASQEKKPLNEDMGEAMARWAKGDVAPAAAEKPQSAYERLWFAVENAGPGQIDELAAGCRAALTAKQISRGEAANLSTALASKREALAGVVNPDAEPPTGAP